MSDTAIYLALLVVAFNSQTFFSISLERKKEEWMSESQKEASFQDVRLKGGCYWLNIFSLFFKGRPTVKSLSSENEF